MSRRRNPLLLHEIREALDRLEAPAAIERRLADDFTIARRTVRANITFVLRKRGEADAKRAPHRAAQFFGNLEAAIQRAANDGDHGAVAKNLALQARAFGLTAPGGVNVAVQVNAGQAAAPQELARLTDAELAVFAALAAKAEGADLDAERLAVLAHVALLPGARGNGPRLLEASCAPTGPDAAQDGAERTPAATSAKPGGFQRWQQERAKPAAFAACEDVPPPSSDDAATGTAPDPDAPEPETW